MEAAPPESAAPKGPGRMPVAGVAVLALAAGLAVGWMMVGPRLAASSPKAAAGVEEGGTEGGHGPAGATHLFTVDGLIVNPAGSRGQHHLIITVSFEVRNPAVHARLRAAEIPLRDAIAAMLESRSLDQLTAPGVREQLRADLAPLVTPYLDGSTVRIFVPQYIVQ